MQDPAIHNITRISSSMNLFCGSLNPGLSCGVARCLKCSDHAAKTSELSVMRRPSTQSSRPAVDVDDF